VVLRDHFTPHEIQIELLKSAMIDMHLSARHVHGENIARLVVGIMGPATNW
jgi:hypothetical protein